jgi:hypothetical protein
MLRIAILELRNKRYKSFASQFGGCAVLLKVFWCENSVVLQAELLSEKTTYKTIKQP